MKAFAVFGFLVTLGLLSSCTESETHEYAVYAATKVDQLEQRVAALEARLGQ